jgi:molecular chaperone GrpE
MLLAVKGKTEKNKVAKKVKKNSQTEKLNIQIDELNVDVEKLNEEIESYKDKNIRLLAEFDNFKRRSIQERKNLTKFAGESLVKDLLPALDDFSRIIESIQEDSPIREGVILVKSKLEKTFEENGIISFESTGNDFDPELHEALMSQETDDSKEGIILNEFEKGYKYHDKILRHAKVVVSKAKQEA